MSYPYRNQATPKSWSCHTHTVIRCCILHVHCICHVVSPEYTYYVKDTTKNLLSICIVIVSMNLYFENFKQISLFVVVYSLYTVLCPVVSLESTYCIHDTTEIPTVYCNSQFVLSCPLSIVILTLYCDSQFVFCILVKAVPAVMLLCNVLSMSLSVLTLTTIPTPTPTIALSEQWCHCAMFYRCFHDDDEDAAAAMMTMTKMLLLPWWRRSCCCVMMMSKMLLLPWWWCYKHAVIMPYPYQIMPLIIMPYSCRNHATLMP